MSASVALVLFGLPPSRHPQKPAGEWIKTAQAEIWVTVELTYGISAGLSCMIAKPIAAKLTQRLGRLGLSPSGGKTELVRIRLDAQRQG